MFDTHIHTRPFSTDGKMTIEESIKRKNELGIGIVITDHIDYDFPPPDHYDFSVAKYFDTYYNMRNNTFFLGIEIGMQEKCMKKNKSLIEKYPFDMVLASLHTVMEYDISYPEYYKTMEKRDAYRKYFETMYDNIRLFHEFDTLTHLDYICRYSIYDNVEIIWDDVEDILLKVFDIIIKEDKALEINSRRLHDEIAFRNVDHIFAKYKKAGGKYVTIGSDAHEARHIALNFDKSKKIIDKYDFTVVHFEQRKMIRTKEK